MWWIGFWPKITISVVHTQLFFTIKKNGQNCHKILQNWIFSFFLPWGLKLLRFMPRPSAQTKYFLSWTKLKLSKTNFLLSKVMQNESLLLKIDFQSGNFVSNDFWKQKMYFLTLDKIFILDNFSFVQDKKYFVRAEGRGIRL